MASGLTLAPLSPLQKPVQSGDVVRTRINSGASLLLHRAGTLSAEAVRTRMNSGASPHHRFSPDFCGEKQDVEASGG